MAWLNPKVEKPEKRKYRLTDETLVHEGRTLHRIQATDYLPALGWEIKRGELGGFVESEANLSHEGTCWIYDDAKVYGDAKVSDFATVVGRSEVSGSIVVEGFARVVNSKITGDYTLGFGDSVVDGEFAEAPLTTYRPVLNGELQ